MTERNTFFRFFEKPDFYFSESKNTIQRKPALYQSPLGKASIFADVCSGDCEYGDEFTRPESDGINVAELAQYIDSIQGLPIEQKLFRFTDYLTYEVKRLPEMGDLGSVIVGANTEIQFNDRFGKAQLTQTQILLNKVDCCLNPIPFFRSWISPEKNLYFVYFIYKGTEENITEVTDNGYNNHFSINKKFIAIDMCWRNAEHMMAFLKSAGLLHFAGSFEKNITEKFVTEIKKHADNGAKLNALYASMPSFTAENLSHFFSNDTLFTHLCRLKRWDEATWFDPSGAILTILRTIKDPRFIYEKFKGNVTFLKELFFDIDGISVMEGNAVPNKIVFADLIWEICRFNLYEGFEINEETPTFYFGEGYKVANHRDYNNDKDPDKYFLKQKIPVTSQREVWLNDEKFRQKVKYEETTLKDRDEGGDYHPFDLVFYVDMASKDKTPVIVPAIYVKAIAHVEKVNDILRDIRIGADLLGIILGVATLGSGSMFWRLIALLDVGISARDLQIMGIEKELMKTEAGREYIENWNRIQLMGGLAFAMLTAPALFRRTFAVGTRAVTQISRLEIRKVIYTSLLRLLLEMNIANFAGNTLKLLNYAEVIRFIPRGIPVSLIDGMYKAGAIFAKGKVANGRKLTEEFFVLYEGEIIARGAEKEVIDSFKSLAGFTREQIIEALDKIINRRRIAGVKNAADLGKSVSNISFELIDEFGNALGTLKRYVKGKELIYSLIYQKARINYKNIVELLDHTSPAIKGLTINKGEYLLFADLNIPAFITKNVSGIGKNMLDDALAFFRASKKHGKVNGVVGYWIEHAELYADYGGKSVNLKKFWEARKAGKSMEDAAFSTFTGEWAEKNLFNRISFNPESISESTVILKFIK
ncbi:MAG: hypothetical protein NTW29_04055 [Bacteroidetes bacterium]|nr:hypothetical protein [Bacteroidota bacterium]